MSCNLFWKLFKKHCKYTAQSFQYLSACQSYWSQWDLCVCVSEDSIRWILCIILLCYFSVKCNLLLKIWRTIWLILTYCDLFISIYLYFLKYFKLCQLLTNKVEWKLYRAGTAHSSSFTFLGACGCFCNSSNIGSSFFYIKFVPKIASWSIAHQGLILLSCNKSPTGWKMLLQKLKMRVSEECFSMKKGYNLT